MLSPPRATHMISPRPKNDAFFVLVTVSLYLINLSAETRLGVAAAPIPIESALHVPKTCALFCKI